MIKFNCKNTIIQYAQLDSQILGVAVYHKKCAILVINDAAEQELALITKVLLNKLHMSKSDFVTLTRY